MIPMLAENSLVTPLLRASASGHLQVVECLLNAGADKEKATNEGATPLHVTTEQSHQAVVNWLLMPVQTKRRRTMRALHRCMLLRSAIRQ